MLSKGMEPEFFCLYNRAVASKPSIRRTPLDPQEFSSHQRLQSL